MLGEHIEVGIDRGPVELLAHPVVVGVRHLQELDPCGPHPADRVDDVVGEKGHVLDARATVEVEVLLDLGLLLPVGRFVDRELDPPFAVPEDLRHERRVLGGDRFVVEVHQLGEPEHLRVELRPAVHRPQFDVRHDMIDEAQSFVLELEKGRLDVMAITGKERS